MIEHPFHVMIVVQQPIFRQGILAILKQVTECEVLERQPNTISEALELAREQEPEVALLDTLCASLDALERARRMRTSSPKTAVLMLSGLEGEEWLFQAIKGGVAAYCTRNVAPAKLVEILQKVSQGEYVLNDDVLSQTHLVS
ncbi:MAG TPA: response regulator transcription factor, partial [Ktedonobacteraceae bacterium]|nr:response regulator transcription factor [Ktedonobacteraceae bacterium]